VRYHITLGILLTLAGLVACAPAGPHDRWQTLTGVHDHLTLAEFRAALEGRWESVYTHPHTGNIVAAEFAGDRCVLTIADGFGDAHVYRGTCTVALERPHHPQQVTFVTVTAVTDRGEIRLQRGWFGLHNAVLARQGTLLRFDRAPYGVLVKLADP
jgi:hypothetical protein